MQVAMTGFDTVVVVDWSARATPSPARPSKDAIFLGICRDGYLATLYQRTRSQAMRNIRGLIDGDLRAGRRILLAFDFPSPIRTVFGENLAGDGDPLALWAYLSQRIEDDDRNGNNRFEVAAALNGMFGQDGPFWGHPVGAARSRACPFANPAMTVSLFRNGAGSKPSCRAPRPVSS
jgi:molybdopterin molybdotransferase